MKLNEEVDNNSKGKKRFLTIAVANTASSEGLPMFFLVV
ncbi:hypothetical protein HNO89_003703 [Sporosarcina luteola]|nr:hypothetical protein [Sporosarcina luteola]